MSNEASQHAFLRELDQKLWAAADKLRNNLDAAQYKHAVLGLIFLKYVSDAFDARRQTIEADLKDASSEIYYEDASPEDLHAELEDRDYYTSANTFWVPPLARWQNLQSWAKLPPQTEVEVKNGKTTSYTIKSIALLVDDALAAVEKENDALKNVLAKDTYARLQLDPDNLRGLIDLVASIPFTHDQLQPKDILGHVYEYFLGQFALAEGKKGGQYFTPKSIVGLIVEMLQPTWGRVYDPAMASTMTFDQAVAAHAKYSGSPGPEAEQVLLDFLGWDVPQEEWFGQEVRIVLVAPDFHKEVTTSVMWLNQRDLDITCVRIRPHRQGENVILDVQRIIPLPEAEDFLVRAKEKSRETRRSARGDAWVDGEGYWFVNVGESDSDKRRWEDCQRYGFMHAGGGPEWISQISRLQPGDKIVAYLSRHGYVGVGEVVSEAVMQRDFVSPVEQKRLIDLPFEGVPVVEHLDDPDRCDWCVGVNWLATVPRDEALKLEARRQTVCKLHDRELVESILSYFTPGNIPEKAPGSEPGNTAESV